VSQNILDEIRAFYDRLAPKRVLICAPGRGDPLRACLQSAIAAEKEPMVALALQRVEIRESNLCNGDQAYVVPHPETFLQRLDRMSESGDHSH